MEGYTKLAYPYWVQDSQGKLLTAVQTVRVAMNGEGLGPVPQTDSMAGSLKGDIRACVVEVEEHS